MALTDTAIRALRHTTRPYKVYDRDGLFLLINPSGSKLWRWRYYTNGREKLMALGEYPVVGLADVRERHLAVRKKLANGIDPMNERKAAAIAQHEKAKELLRQAESSVEKVARRWWASWSLEKSPRHAAQVLRRLEADVFPDIGHKFVDDVRAADVRQLVLAIEARGARDVAKRAQETIGQIFRFAIANGLATRNPAADFRPSDILKPSAEVNFARVDEKDLPKLLAKIWTYKGDILTIYAMRLMAYLWVRTSELIEGEWPEFELDKAKWEIPPERMKKRRPHVVPLPHQAVTILRDLFARTGKGKHIFPGANDTAKTMSNNTILSALYRLGYKGEMTGHGFRGIASTVLYESSLFEGDWIEVQLAHVEENKVKGAYNKAKYIKQRTDMMQWWADFIDEKLAEGLAALAS